MKFNLIQIAGIVAVILSGLIALYFIQTRKEKSQNITLLSGLLFVYAFMIIWSLILSSGINPGLFKIAHIGNQSIFLVGPLLFLYIKSQVKPNLQLSNKSVYHLIPFLAATLYLIIKFYIYHFPITCRVNHVIVGSVAFAHALVYFVLSTIILRQNGFSLSAVLKKSKDSKIAWLPFLLNACFLIWLVKLLFFIVWDVSGYYQGCNELANLYFLISFMALISFAYYILLKPNNFGPTKKYKHSALSKNEKIQYKEKLISIMEEGKAYMNPLISLNKLAKQLSIPNRYLSQILNESINMNFYDFINSYRIKDCVAYLSDEKHSKKTILEIAYEVGFNSKSTFNASFVKFVGVTPKQFRKSQQVKRKVNEPELCLN